MSASSDLAPGQTRQWFNELNAMIVHGFPEMARATRRSRHLPLLREMQGLLSQRPKHAAGGGFRCCTGRPGKRFGSQCRSAAGPASDVDAMDHAYAGRSTIA